MRRMADKSFREQQWAGRYDAHVRPVNELVDRLRDVERGWLPYVAPCHGGVQGRILSVLRDPGPMTREDGGSGLLCIENDDQTAERQATAFAEVGVDPRDITPWNAYPWYINRVPTAAELGAGVAPLVAVLELMPRIRVVLLQGRQARDAWKRLRREHPELERDRGLAVLDTYHPSRQALWHPDLQERERRERNRREIYREVARVLAGA